MSTISLVDRVRLNYAITTITSIVLYTFTISSLAHYFTSLWPQLFYFILSELVKLIIVQKVYSLYVTYTQDGVRKWRSNKISEGLKFAGLTVFTVLAFAFICIVMGGKLLQLCHGNSLRKKTSRLL